MEHFALDLQSSERFSLAIEATRDGIWEWNILTNQVFFSPRFCEIIGYSFGDPELQHTFSSWTDRIHPDDYERVIATLADHLEKRTSFDVEYRHRHESGEYRWQNSRGQAFYDVSSEPVKMVGCISDISVRKQLEKELHESKALFETVVENIPLIIFLKEATDLRFVIFNRAGEDLLGYDRTALLGKNNLDLFPSEQATHFMAKDREVLDKETGMLDISEELILTAMKGQRMLHTRKICVRGDDGATKYLLGISEDITERKRTQKVLQEAKVAAESANRAKSAFLANMSHELRTPMNGVIGMTELLKMTDLTEEQLTYVEALTESGNNLLSLINDVLDLSKIEAGKIELEPTEFSLHRCINDVILTQKSVIYEKGLSLKVEIAKEIPNALVGDPLRLKQIILNLLGNAAKFTAQGGITISARVLERHEASVLVQIAVCDTGVGICADALDEIFQPFVQENGSTTRKFGGTGLGLTISRRLAELMEGSISVESAPGVGSCFNVVLPFLFARKDVTEVDSKDKTELNWDGAPQRILFVEDNSVNTKFGTTLLRKQGHDVVSVLNGLECLVALKNGRFDVVLMDIQMPVMGGEEALREIRAKEQGTSLHQPVIALTAYALRGDKERLVQQGFDGYLSKPFKAKGLMCEMKRVIESGRC